MNNIIEILSKPWPWYVAGPVIATVMFLLIYFGNSFGISANLRTVCSAIGGGRNCDFFDFNWKSQIWNLVFALGMIIGGFVSHTFFSNDEGIGISEETVQELEAFGIADPGGAYVPEELFSWDALLSVKGVIIMVLGGFLVGFGTRYAGGCTSGHAISGLSDLQLPSLIAVIGFFIGGLIMTYIFLPLLFNI